MKNVAPGIVRTLVLLPAVALLAPVSALAQWTLILEPNHSNISFTVPIAGGITKVRGTFKEYSVDITYQAADITAGRVEVVIQAASIDTNNETRDRDLREDRFFDVEHHPVITFSSVRIDRRRGGFVAVGPLTINGITRTVEVPFQIAGLNEVDGRPLIGVTALLSINRKDFDLGTDWRHTVIPNFLGDIVTVEADIITRPGKRIPANE